MGCQSSCYRFVTLAWDNVSLTGAGVPPPRVSGSFPFVTEAFRASLRGAEPRSYRPRIVGCYPRSIGPATSGSLQGPWQRVYLHRLEVINVFKEEWILLRNVLHVERLFVIGRPSLMAWRLVGM